MHLVFAGNTPPSFHVFTHRNLLEPRGAGIIPFNRLGKPILVTGPVTQLVRGLNRSPSGSHPAWRSHPAEASLGLSGVVFGDMAFVRSPGEEEVWPLAAEG